MEEGTKEEGTKEDALAMEAGKNAQQLSDSQQPASAPNVPACTMQPPPFATGQPPAGSQYAGQANLGPAAAMPKPAFERDSPFDRTFRDAGKGEEEWRWALAFFQLG
jgi:hypothetical protein